MSAKRFISRDVIIVLLALTLIATGCATTSSQAAKPHKPQMITSNGPVEVGNSTFVDKIGNGFGLSDDEAGSIAFFGWFLQFFNGTSWGL